MSRVPDRGVLPAPGERAAPPGRSNREDALRLIAVTAAAIGLAYATGYGETVLLLLLVVGCIAAHEFGHFIAARTGGIKVTEFFVGFGPRLWSVRRGETEYGVKGIPLGGYCRIIGMNNLEDVDPEDESRTYRAAPMWRRLLIDVAGSSMHFVIALAVLFAMFFWTGDQGYYLQPPAVASDAPIASLTKLVSGPSPAEKAGFKVGDRVESVNGRHFQTWEDQSKFIQAFGGRPLDVVVDRHSRLIHLTTTPELIDQNDVVGRAQLVAPKVVLIGLSPAPTGTVHSSFGASVSRAGGAFVSVGARTFVALGHLVTFSGLHSYFDMLSNQKAAAGHPEQQLTTVVQLPSVFHQASRDGLATVLWLFAVINLSIGIINLLPFFPLDGGRVAVGLYEGMRSIRRPYRVDMAKLVPVMYTMLMLFLLYSAGWMLINIRTLSS